MYYIAAADVNNVVSRTERELCAHLSYWGTVNRSKCIKYNKILN